MLKKKKRWEWEFFALGAQAAEKLNLICIGGREFPELHSHVALTIPPLFPPLTMCCFFYGNWTLNFIKAVKFS